MDKSTSFALHHCQYYETDAMGVIHHGNHVKWMEEARLRYYKESGFNYEYLERELGIMIAVTFQSVEYKDVIRFDEVIGIECKCIKFNGVKMEFEYLFRSIKDGVIKAVGITKHCFVDKSYKPVILSRLYPSGYECLKNRIY